MRVALIYDLFSDYPRLPHEPADAHAENEPEATVEALEHALQALGHEPVRVGPPSRLLEALPTLTVDAAVNIAEGAWTRNREGWAPTLLEMAGIPFVGSDALTLSLSLDKAWTKDLALAAGLQTPPYAVYRSADEVDPGQLPAPFPLFVKPRFEGSAKGIDRQSRVEDAETLVEVVGRLTERYRQEVIVEAFVRGGGEYTVAVVGHNPPRALPVLQRATDPLTGVGTHALSQDPEEYELLGSLDAALEKRLQADALRIFEKLDCRDFARSDFRVDAAGQVWFLEINPLPTFAPDGTFAILAELSGRPYAELLAEVLGQALERASAANQWPSYLDQMQRQVQP